MEQIHAAHEPRADPCTLNLLTNAGRSGNEKVWAKERADAESVSETQKLV